LLWKPIALPTEGKKWLWELHDPKGGRERTPRSQLVKIMTTLFSTLMIFSLQAIDYACITNSTWISCSALQPDSLLSFLCPLTLHCKQLK